MYNSSLIQHMWEMEPAKEIFTKEIVKFTEKYSELGELTIKMQPDIATMDFIYDFEKSDCVSNERFDQILSEVCDHMDGFCRENDIMDFYLNTIIFI